MALVVFFVWVKTPSVALNKTVALNDLERSLNAAKDGDTLFLTEGDYTLAHTVKLQKSISLIGAGMTKTRVLSSVKTAVLGFQKADLSFKGISFVHMGKQKSDVLDIEDSKVNIDDCSFSGAFSPDSPPKIGDGIWLHGRSSGKISNSKFEKNTLTGLEVQDTSNVQIEQNEFNHNGQMGLSIWKNAKAEVIKSTFQFNNSRGIQVSNHAFAHIDGNEISLNKIAGISFFESSKGSVVNNTIYSNNFGIEIVNQSTVSVSKNNLGSQKEAIYIAKKATATIGQNTFDKNDQDVVYEK